MSTGDWIQTGIGIILFATMLGVYWYANEAKRTVDEIQRSRFDELRPVVDLQRISQVEFGTGQQALREAVSELENGNHAWFALKNIGRGPALNITASIGEELFQPKSLGTLGVLEVAQRQPYEVSDGKVSVEYHDVFGRKFCSDRSVTYDEHGVNVGSLNTGEA